MMSLGSPKIYDLPIIQAIFEGNVIQLTELITQREEVNAVVRCYIYIVHTCNGSHVVILYVYIYALIYNGGVLYN